MDWSTNKSRYSEICRLIYPEPWKTNYRTIDIDPWYTILGHDPWYMILGTLPLRFCISFYFAVNYQHFLFFFQILKTPRLFNDTVIEFQIGVNDTGEELVADTAP